MWYVLSTSVSINQSIKFIKQKDHKATYIASNKQQLAINFTDVTSSGRAFQVFGPATGKARLPTVDRLTDGTRRRLVPVERSDRLPGRLRTGGGRL